MSGTPLAVVGISQFDASTPRGGSGLPYHLFGAVREQGVLASVHGVGLGRAQRVAALAAAVHPDRARWQRRYWHGPAGYRLLSRNADAALAAAPARPREVALQAYGMFRITARPYAMFLDATTSGSARSYAPAIPWGRVARRRLERWEGEAYRGAVHLFAAAEHVRASLVGDHGIDPARVTVTGEGANLELPDLDGVAEARRAGPPTVLFVGREFDRKGGDVLVAAFARLRERAPDARLVVVGGHRGDPAPGVEWVGELADPAALSARYREATVFCLPSYFEPYGIVLLEAMGHALPSVVSSSGGLGDNVEDGATGRIVPAGDVEATAAALWDVVGDPERAATWGAAARRRVEQGRSWSDVGATVVATLDRLVR